ncbi:mpp10 protein [Moesziomyces antarcticus]|uniref:Related to MPP10 - component of the U3 small nucleolar ribonucleoprotein n=2 Tax=Pseudozyma antarctica TaxID=84753 RepID=A0A5C3FLV0_PSEA2|nr:mpp10 protein [Moesziomyces antarcticus]GAK65705.1 mpp10 protein [Moesziomyces antarcticus]SPO45332.1 related to MPP10 - component of the U3 small nucleolar ribonucleoprotein [Moesziomyces antarcticus]
MPSSPRKGAKASAPATTAQSPSQPSEPSTSTSLPQLSKAHELAELIATNPERLANPDTSLSQLSVSALKQLFDHAVRSEKNAVPAICSFINTIAPNSAAPDQRASRSGGKRKRGQAAPAAAPVFEATPLDELIIQGMDSRQLWEQLDLKASQMSRLVERYFAQGLIREEEEDEEDEDDNSRAGPSRTRKHAHDDESSDDDDDDDDEDDSDGQEDDEEFDPEEERVKLSQLSDADLRALGIDPALREQFLAELAQEQGDDDDDDQDSDEEGSPYAGASDISDGDPTEVFYEPLKTEAEQLRRREEQEMGMLPRLRSQVGHDDDDEDEFEQQGSDDEDDIESEEEQEQSPNKRGKRARASDIPESLLQDLDRPGEAATRPAKRHPTLDDDFFSIDDLNKQLDEQDAEEEADPADESEEEDLDNQVDFYKPLAGDQDMDDDDDDADAGEAAEAAAVDAADAHYADFFLPPAKAERFNKKFGKRKASARFATQDAAADEQADDHDDEQSEQESESGEPTVRVHEEPDRKRSIRFNDTIEYRRIKPRKKSADDLTPEMLRMIGASSDDVDAARDFDEDDDDDDEERSGQDDDDEDMDMDEVESETSSIGRHASDDEEDDEEDQDRADMSEDESEGSQAGSDDGQGAKTARRVAGDLFADSDDEDDAQDKLSTHEKRVAALQEEIARLEDENVAKKEWTLMGEAGSRARPQDSLLEQDLEFERAAKVVPQVTEEMTESLEQLIKRRILERNFDDVIRRRELEALPFLPSRLLELSDSKSAKSLAELYEEEYQAARGGADGDEGAPVAEADAKLAKEHEEITQLYDDIFNKLDALSNAHFTPRAPKATIQTITNAPSVAIESALPATASSSTMLAPEEVYERAKHSTAMEGAKSEMTPEEKQRLHNKLRAEKRKRNDRIQDTQKALEMSGLVRAKKVNDKEEKQQALKKLVGNRGVSVIGKEPNAVGAGSGKKAKKGANGAAAKPTTANQFKL